jgi:hypothetical protein
MPDDGLAVPGYDYDGIVRDRSKLPASEDDEWADAFWDAGYDYCRAHKDWHRPPECEIDENGNPDPSWNRIDDEEEEEA